MHSRTRENLLYVGEELVSRFGKSMLLLALFLTLCGGFAWSFHKVDAYLKPSWTKEETKTLQKALIAIPKIGVEAPIIFVDSANPVGFLEPLKNGVAHYPSALPGQKGVAVILGHSAPSMWIGNKYDDVFSDLKDLEIGDRIIITLNGEAHTYEVHEKLFLNRGQDVPVELMQSDGARLLLLSCWPPGINNKRILIQAEII